jgi:predicted peptidase
MQILLKTFLMKNRLSIRQLLILMAFSPLMSSAQETYYFKTGLTIDAGAKYGREALHLDPLAFKLYTKTLSRPVDGGLFGKDLNDENLKWVKVDADSANRFRRIRSANYYRGANNYIYLSYNASKDKTALLNIKGNSAVFVNGELHAGDPYADGFMNIPVRLKAGLNEFYVRGQGIIANLTFSAKPVMLNVQDPTLPFIVEGHQKSDLKGAVIVINTSANALKNLQIVSTLNGKELRSTLPVILANSSRKVIFTLDGESANGPGTYDCTVSLRQNGKELDQQKVKIEYVAANEKYVKTFVSKIDGSLQYYAIAPKRGTDAKPSALFLSVHGAGVEAIGQARAYESKDWGNIVTPTNRRPRGFNWEDWGRLDALEVLELAKMEFKPDLKRIYLTGHSMGGHGTWFLGATYPDKWAAIAPSAGYPTMKGYGSADGLIPDSSQAPIGQILLRASNQSDVPKLALNYKQLGVYVLHGDADRTVSVDYARQMKQQLASFHADFSYYEYPGGSHWYGNESVDWKPLFDFFRWHTLPVDSAVNYIDFTTASPGISASNHWITIHQQMSPLKYSRVVLTRNKKEGRISGTTENVRLLKIGLAEFGTGAELEIKLDSLSTVTYRTRSIADSIFLIKDQNKWAVVPAPGFKVKGPHRYGTFKEGFNKNMVYVYGTTGSAEENAWSMNKARYDAESWYYRGNGAVDVITDKEYSLSKYKGRNVVLVGNASTNAIWNTLLKDCPIRITRNNIHAGTKTWQGDDLGAYFVWPIAGTLANTVSVISGSGLNGMNAVNANQYFAGGSGFPDIMIYKLNMLNSGVEDVVYAGFYDNNWNLGSKDLISK